MRDRLKPYSCSGVIHGLSRSCCYSSAIQTVNNAVAMRHSNISGLSLLSLSNYFGFGSGTNTKPVRSTNIVQHLDRSRNPNTDTHPQVMTPNVSFYTDCAPCSLQKQV